MGSFPPWGAHCPSESPTVGQHKGPQKFPRLVAPGSWPPLHLGLCAPCRGGGFLVSPPKAPQWGAFNTAGASGSPDPGPLAGSQTQPEAKMGALKNLCGMSPGVAGKPGPFKATGRLVGVKANSRKGCPCGEKEGIMGWSCAKFHRNKSVRPGRGTWR